MQLFVNQRGDAAHARSDRPTISASEIGNYGYCARSWWLKRVRSVRVQSHDTLEGNRVHAAAGRVVTTVVWIDRVVKVMAWAVLLAGTLLLMTLVRR